MFVCVHAWVCVRVCVTGKSVKSGRFVGRLLYSCAHISPLLHGRSIDRKAVAASAHAQISAAAIMLSQVHWSWAGLIRSPALPLPR